jgi:hypothetical protein
MSGDSEFQLGKKKNLKLIEQLGIFWKTSTKNNKVENQNIYIYKK